MAEKMAFFLARRKIVSEDRADLYGYGLEILFATVINGILAVTAALVLGVFWQAILVLVPFILICGNAGGFHAKTHTGCMLGFLSVYTAGLLAIRWSLFGAAAFISMPAAATVILTIGALPHKNRPVSSRELTRFKVKARIMALCLLAAGLVGLTLAPAWFTYFALGMDIAAGSLLAGCIQSQGEEAKRV
jgi:accessory gene regulator B